MNTQTLHEKLRLAAHIVEHKLPWEFKTPSDDSWQLSTGQQIITCISLGWETRLADAWLPHYDWRTPCDEKMLIDILRRNKDEKRNSYAEDYFWSAIGVSSDIIAWRPAKVEPFNLRAHVKQSFPGLRDAHVFHRDDFTADDLPPGYRPMLLNENGDYEWTCNKQWNRGVSSQIVTRKYDDKNRTTRPLPVLSPQEVADGWIEWRGGDCPVLGGSIPTVMLKNGEINNSRKAQEWRWVDWDDYDIIAYKPDPYGKFRQALADGKRIEWNFRGDEWQKDANPNFALPPDRYRIAPEKKRVKLGPEDVLPFSVVRRKPEQDNDQQWHWRCVSYVHGIGIQCGNRGYKWKELQNDYQINRSIPLTGKWDAEAWEPCYKEVEV